MEITTIKRELYEEVFPNRISNNGNKHYKKITIKKLMRIREIFNAEYEAFIQKICNSNEKYNGEIGLREAYIDYPYEDFEFEESEEW